MVNTEQLAAWDGEQGSFWARRADRFDAGIAAHRGELLRAAGIAATDTVLDIGCGAGQSTRDAARRAPLGPAEPRWAPLGPAALGIDLSIAQLTVTREAAAREQVGNATFIQADAQVHPSQVHPSPSAPPCTATPGRPRPPSRPGPPRSSTPRPG